MSYSSIFDPAAPHNDKVIVAYYTPLGYAKHFTFSFGNLKPGSNERIARCGEYDRILEAYRGQGCEVHCWALEHWPRYREAFYNYRLCEDKKLLPIGGTER